MTWLEKNTERIVEYLIYIDIFTVLAFAAFCIWIVFKVSG